MTANSKIPHEFKAKVFPGYVRIATANAIIGAQYVERVLNAICSILQTKGLRFTTEDFMSGDSSKTKQTLGMIGTQLRQTHIFDKSFSRRLTVFSKRRNRVVHGLFADTFKSEEDINFESPIALNYIKECEWLANEGAELVEVGFGIFRALGNIHLKSQPDNPQIINLLNEFEEFHERGMEAITPKFRPFLKPRWMIRCFVHSSLVTDRSP